METKEKGPAYLEGKKILAVDDFEKWLKTVKGNAEYYGARERDIFFAYNAKEGERVYTLERPDIVISDINFDANDLRNRDGLGFISFVNTNRVSGLALAAMSSLDPTIKEEALRAGADYFINKKDFTSDWDFFVERVRGH